MNELSILFVKDGGEDWTAQCLEYDIASHGSTIKEAMDMFQKVLASEIAYSLENHGKPTLEGIPSAPQYYWKLFDEAAEPIKPKSPAPFRLKGLDIPALITLPTLKECRVT